MSRKHKDINKAHALLEGEGWYIIEPNQLYNGKRRHYTRCKYYRHDIKGCKLKGICNGSGKCTDYKE